MDCTHCREIVSARLDGEDRPGEWDLALRHLAACAACRAFRTGAESLHRAARVAPAAAVPDLTAAILAATAPVEPAEQSDRFLRGVLLAVAAAQIALAVPGLVLGDGAGLTVHAARHLGSFDVALAVGFAWAAFRPVRALGGLLPVAGALVACLVGTSLLDVASGRAPAAGELTHLTELAGVAALWLLGRPVTAAPAAA